MDLNELQSVQSRERQTDSLQQLRATFYQDAADYIQDLEAERDAAAERADDPWSAPEVGRLNDDIDTAKGTVEAIYDRRVGKIVKIASLAAADMPTDDEGLTEEEQALFDQLVAAIEHNRDGVFAILDGEDPPIDPTGAELPPETGSPPPESRNPSEPGTSDADPAASPADPSTPAASGDDHREVPPDPDPSEPGPAAGEASEPDVGAADLMGGTETTDDGQSGAGTAAADAAGADQPVRDGGATEVRSSDSGAQAPDDVPGDDGTDDSGSDRPDEGDAHPGDPDVDRTMVRITDDVGPIYGVEGREYDLTANDVVTLPEANVGPLLKQGAAERLD